MRTVGTSVVLALLSIVARRSWCAERNDVKELLERHVRRQRELTSNAMTSFRFRRDAMPMEELTEALALDDDASMQVLQTATTVQGTQILKLQERYKGEDVWDGVVTLETNGEGHVLDASGTVYRHIDLDDKRSVLDDPEQALDLCVVHNGHQKWKNAVSHVQVKKEVMFDEHTTAYQAYTVMYHVHNDADTVQRPACIIDARKPGSVTVSWDSMESCSDCQATGVGGNGKVGKIRYGQLQRCLDVRQEGDVCYLDNKYVRILDNNSTFVLTEDIEKFALENGTTADPAVVEIVSYNCRDAEDDQVNGAFSPMLDALFHGTVVSRMFEDWYGMPLPLGEKVTFRIHFGADWANAIWTGQECAFGDGNGETIFPLVSLDIIAHEIGHGITEKNSNLLYFQQWGGINEAFSDMCGEAAEAYLDDQDWLVGADVFPENGRKALRFFQNPEADNRSISNADNFTDFLDPHLGSGVFNRAFYILIHDLKLPIREVFGVFLHANRMYWHHMSSYASAACDVMKAAYDKGQDGHKFREAFQEVGIDVCEVESHVLGLVNKKEYSNITVSRDVHPTFSFVAPEMWTEAVTITASGSRGDVIISVSDAQWGITEVQKSIYATGVGSLTVPVSHLVENSPAVLTITLTTTSPHSINDVTLQATYSCVKNFTTGENATDRESHLKELWTYFCKEFIHSEDKDETKTGEDDDNGTHDNEENGDNTNENGDNTNDGDVNHKDQEIETDHDGHKQSFFFNFKNSLIFLLFPQKDN